MNNGPYKGETLPILVVKFIIGRAGSMIILAQQR
jgi:hypothetical protein